jgi:hypothetical protein
MSYTTQPAFVTSPKGWDDDMLRHPMLKFMHEHAIDFDAKDYHNGKPYYTSDYTYTKSDGRSFTGDAAIKQQIEDYALFKEHFHEPNHGVITEIENGYQLSGFATMYVNLPVPGEKKYTDLQGRQWECVAHGAFRFEVVRDPTGVQGFRFSKFRIFADPTPILGEAIKCGVIPVEALTG